MCVSRIGNPKKKTIMKYYLQNFFFNFHNDEFEMEKFFRKYSEMCNSEVIFRRGKIVFS